MEPYVVFDRFEDRARYLPNNAVVDNADFGSVMAEYCTQLGCPFIDTFPALRHAATLDHKSLYIPDDEHLDVQGHEVIAQIVLKWLDSQGIVGLGAVVKSSAASTSN